MKSMPKEYFDLLIVVPLEVELREVQAYFEEVEDRSDIHGYRSVVNCGQSLRGLVVLQEEMGRSAAARSVSASLNDYKFGLIVCVGIAGGLSEDVKIGDVCYTGTIIDVYDNAKASDHPSGGLEVEFSPVHLRTNRQITTAFNLVRTIIAIRHSYERWQEEQEEKAKSLIPGSFKGRGCKEERIEKPISVNGAIVCGIVSKSEFYKDKLKSIERKVLAIETESGGIFEEAASFEVPAISIRGISDYADSGKGTLEAETRGHIRKIAASNAASFLNLQLRNPHVVSLLHRYREERLDEQNLPLEFIAPPVARIDAVLERVGASIDQHLRDLSPEYRLQPRGYRLPTPRVRRAEYTAGISSPAESEPAEIRDVLRIRDRIVVTIPKTYPDQSLAWIIANDLITAELDGAQPIPLVIDGGALRPPNQDIGALAGGLIEDALNIDGAEIVLIIDNPLVRSKSRLNFLIEQTKRYSQCKIVFVIRDEIDLALNALFVQAVDAETYKACEISFGEIAHFMQKNFEMNDAEAEVIALRLRQIFKRYHLDAHPTYFAGISRETLTTLLQANRRAELIQLATDGFLTFVVADDTADVTLSRTTRFRFLRRLAAAINLQKIAFTQSRLIEFTLDFANEYDFEIDPLEFIQGFLSKGILHFYDGCVQMTLPFIAHYALAVELIGDAKSAKTYFDLNSPTFDSSTFDLYAELGASTEIVHTIIEAVEQSQNQLQLNQNENSNILATNRFRPAIIGKQDTIISLQKRLQQAIDSVVQGGTGSAEKQRLLDAADRVTEAASTAASSTTAKAEESDPETQLLSRGVRNWAIAVMLLGSGAEHLNAETKRRIIAAVLRLAPMILDKWMGVLMRIDFAGLSKVLTSDEVITSILGTAEAEHLQKDMRRLMSGLIEIIELRIFGAPVAAVLQHLCEHARQVVLASSIDSVAATGRIEAAIQGVWLADIDSRRGRHKLKESLTKLNSADFFRFCLAQHLLVRVYWSQSKKEARLDLLDAADECLKAIAFRINKPKLKRLIEGNPSPPE